MANQQRFVIPPVGLPVNSTIFQRLTFEHAELIQAKINSISNFFNQPDIRVLEPIAKTFYPYLRNYIASSNFSITELKLLTHEELVNKIFDEYLPDGNITKMKKGSSKKTAIRDNLRGDFIPRLKLYIEDTTTIDDLSLAKSFSVFFVNIIISKVLNEERLDEEDDKNYKKMMPIIFNKGFQITSAITIMDALCSSKRRLKEMIRAEYEDSPETRLNKKNVIMTKKSFLESFKKLFKQDTAEILLPLMDRFVAVNHRLFRNNKFIQPLTINNPPPRAIFEDMDVDQTASNVKFNGDNSTQSLIGKIITMSQTL